MSGKETSKQKSLWPSVVLQEKNICARELPKRFFSCKRKQVHWKLKDFKTFKSLRRNIRGSSENKKNWLISRRESHKKGGKKFCLISLAASFFLLLRLSVKKVRFFYAASSKESNYSTGFHSARCHPNQTLDGILKIKFHNWTFGLLRSPLKCRNNAIYKTKKVFC